MQILTQNGFKDFKKIIKNGKSNKILEFELSNNKIFKCTEDHKILKYNKQFVKAKNLVVNDVLYNNIQILKIKKLNKIVDVYDVLNVKDLNSFYTNGIIVHNCLVCDELASVPPNQAEDFWASNYPTISASKEAKIVVISTPEGLFNLFHRLWVGAENKKNSFKCNKVTWRDVPGRDEKWAEEERANLGETKFLQEQEVQFLGSSSTLISPEVLETLLNSYINPERYELDHSFAIYQNPQVDATYVCGVDVGKGTGGDYGVVQVLKIISLNPVSFEQVAVYRNNIIDAYAFSEIVNRISIYYNSAYIMCENNAEGAAVITQLWWEYENMQLINYATKRAGKKELGIRATKKTKPLACALLKRLVEYGNVKLYDQTTIEELSTFVEEKGKYFGKSLNDDTVTSLYWALFILETKVLTDDISLGQNKPSPNEEEGWGILTDVKSEEEDWSWVTDSGWG